MQLQGTVQEVIYKNLENGYTIFVLSCQDENVTVTGKMPVIAEGEQVDVTGEYRYHPKYGMQFVANLVQIHEPTTPEAIVKYLSSGLISGVGEVTAKNIVQMFGTNALDVIEHSPQELVRVKNVSAKKAALIAATYADIKKMQDAVMFLQAYDISINMAVKIYHQYKQKTRMVLEQNPYQLIEDVDGIGFRTADKIAAKLGVQPNSHYRYRAGIVYVLTELAGKTGSTIATKEYIVSQTATLLQFEHTEQTEQDIENSLQMLIIEGIVKKVEQAEQVYYAFARYYEMEKTTAARLVKLLHAHTEQTTTIEQELKTFEQSEHMQLHPAQKDAVLMALENGVSVITGGPGTGKTTIMKAACKLFRQRGKKVMLMAPTGRAAKRLSESTGLEAKTIHRALEFGIGAHGHIFQVNEHNPLEVDAVLVDECSMIDISLMHALVRALPLGAQLVCIGDKDQLPSVGAGNVLADLLACPFIPSTHLTQVYRQAQESKIITNAHKINEQQMPDLSDKSGDFFFMYAEEPARVQQLVVNLVCERLPNYLQTEPSKIQVIAPTKAGLAGVDALNALLQQTINPAQKGKEEITLTKRIFRQGDKVMQIVNNYDQEWLKEEQGHITHGTGVFNGDMGTVEEINPQTNELRVQFDDGRLAHYSMAELDDLTLSYAITVHKSQGSEFDAVVIPITGGNPMLYNKNLLYTAVTRAKKLVVLVGNPKSIYSMVKNVLNTHRETMLLSLLRQAEQTFQTTMGA